MVEWVAAVDASGVEDQIWTDDFDLNALENEANAMQNQADLSEQVFLWNLDRTATSGTSASASSALSSVNVRDILDRSSSSSSNVVGVASEVDPCTPSSSAGTWLRVQALEKMNWRWALNVMNFNFNIMMILNIRFDISWPRYVVSQDDAITF